MPDYQRATCLTFDIDWAPEFIIDQLRSTLDELDLPATIFFTHASAASQRLASSPRCEVGIHPNFLTPNEKRAPEEVIDELLADYPTRAMRSHALYYHSRLLPLLHQAGLRYLSNDLRFLQPGLAPAYDWSGLVRLPIYWEDDVHCVYHHGRDAFSLDTLKLDSPGMKVFNFHPVHLFLNTNTFTDYFAAKDRLKDEKVAWSLRKQNPGVRTLFEQLVANPPTDGWVSLGEIADTFAEQTPYEGQYPAFVDDTKEQK